MTHPTEQATPSRHPYGDLIDEAEAATGILPTIEDCERLAGELRAAIGPLADQVRRRQDRLSCDTVDWTVCERALLDAQGALCGSLGLGLRSAALHVATLGAAVRRLVGCMDDD